MGGYHRAESAGSKRRAAWRDDTTEVHTDKLVSRDLCSVADLPGSRISQPTAVTARQHVKSAVCKTRLSLTTTTIVVMKGHWSIPRLKGSRLEDCKNDWEGWRMIRMCGRVSK